MALGVLDGPGGFLQALVTCHPLFHGAPRSCHPPVLMWAPLHVPAINSCAMGNGGCQHDCVQLTVTQHRCQCRPEFQLQEDGKRCVRECAPALRRGHGAGTPVLHAPTDLPRSPVA